MTKYSQEDTNSYMDKWKREQDVLRKSLITRDEFEWKFVSRKNDQTATGSRLRYIGGVDISFDKEDPDRAVASLVVLTFPELKVVYSNFCSRVIDLPYIPGFLGFREVDVFIELLNSLREDDLHSHMMPQVILVDGNGVMHYRGFGSACHFGVIANIPVIGVAKNLLAVEGLTRDMVRNWSKQHLHKGGDTYTLIGPRSGSELGSLLLPTDGCTNPIFVSIGNRISLPTAVDIVRDCCLYRVPEPIRQADLLSRQYIRQKK